MKIRIDDESHIIEQLAEIIICSGEDEIVQKYILYDTDDLKFAFFLGRG